MYIARQKLECVRILKFLAGIKTLKHYLFQNVELKKKNEKKKKLNNANEQTKKKTIASCFIRIYSHIDFWLCFEFSYFDN